MKNVVTTAAATLFGLFISADVFAQTCGSPLAFNSPSSGPTASGTTCGATDAVSQYCGALDSAGKPDVIYTITLAAAGGRTVTQITVGGGAAGFTPSAFMYTASCATGDGCQATGDTSSPMSLSSPAAPAGTYVLAVSASPVDASAACGAYTLTADGTLPVQLQNFSVE